MYYKMYYKMFFCETNGDHLMYAMAADGRALYMRHDGREPDYPTDREGWAEATEAEREVIASEHMWALGKANGFNVLYANCEKGNNGFAGTTTAEDVARNLRSGDTMVIAAVGMHDFAYPIA